jgi:hypothetical protein
MNSQQDHEATPNKKMYRSSWLREHKAQLKWVFGLARVQVSPLVLLNHCFYRAPADALIDLIVRCRLPHQIPVWLPLCTLARLRLTVLPQGWPAG